MVKQGFSLAEALIVMAILSIFFAFGAKTVTIAQKPKTDAAFHGYFECWQSGNLLNERYVLNGAISALRNNIDTCVFDPKPGSAIFFLRGHLNSKYYNDFEPNINHRLSIRFSGNSFTINGFEMIPDDSNSAGEYFESQLSTDYVDSMLYNAGDPLNGVIIIW